MEKFETNAPSPEREIDSLSGLPRQTVEECKSLTNRLDDMVDDAKTAEEVFEAAKKLEGYLEFSNLAPEHYHPDAGRCNLQMGMTGAIELWSRLQSTDDVDRLDWTGLDIGMPVSVSDKLVALRKAELEG